MKTILALLILAAVSCAPPVVPRAIVPTAPPRSASVSPAVEMARAAGSKAAIASDRLERQVETLKQTASALNDGMADAVLEADRLRKQKSANEVELQGLWEKLTAVKQRNLFLEVQADEAVKYAVDQKTLRLEAEASLTAVSRIAADRDAEVISLRLQRGDMTRIIHEQGEAFDAQAAQLVTAQKQAAVGGFLKWCLFGVVALCAGYLLIRTYVPRLTFP